MYDFSECPGTGLEPFTTEAFDFPVDISDYDMHGNYSYGVFIIPGPPPTSVSD